MSSNSDTVINATVSPEVSGSIEVESAPLHIEDTIHEAGALIKWPAWVRGSYVQLIRGLKCFEVVRRLVIEGTPAIEVARTIQSLGELTEDLTLAENCVKHYRATLPKGELVAARKMPLTPNLESKLNKRIDVRDDLEKLKNWMFERLEIAVNREKSFGMLLPNTEKSFSVALEIVSKLHDIQEKEIGRPEEVQKITAESWTKTDFDNLYQKPGINDTLKNPVSRMKIARFLDQTMQLVGNMDEQQRERVLEAAKKQVEVLPPESTSDPK